MAYLDLTLVNDAIFRLTTKRCLIKAHVSPPLRMGYCHLLHTCIAILLIILCIHVTQRNVSPKYRTIRVKKKKRPNNAAVIDS